MTRRPDQIDWSALSHAYGSAEDIPEAIEALADPERVESAVDSFYDACCTSSPSTRRPAPPWTPPPA